MDSTRITASQNLHMFPKHRTQPNRNRRQLETQKSEKFSSSHQFIRLLQ